MPDLLGDQKQPNAGVIKVGSSITEEDITPSDAPGGAPDGAPDGAPGNVPGGAPRNVQGDAPRNVPFHSAGPGGEFHIERGNLDPNFIDERQYVPLALRDAPWGASHKPATQATRETQETSETPEYAGLTRAQKRGRRSKSKSKEIVQTEEKTEQVWGAQPELYKNAYSYKLYPPSATIPGSAYKTNSEARRTEFNTWSKAEKRKANTGPIMEWVRPIVIAIVLAVILRSFIFEFVYVDGLSMNPTLADSEMILAVKLMYNFTPPSLGDVVVCTYPRRDGFFVKRIIGLGGDTILIEGGRLTRNGELVDEPYVNITSGGDFGPYTIPEGFVFVAGDNREISIDSRSENVGALAASRVVGEVEVVLFPLNKIKTID